MAVSIETRLAQLRQAPNEFRAVVEGAKEEQLDLDPGPGSWTARQIIHHVADAEANGYIRLRKLFAELNPILDAYDQDRWADELKYSWPVEGSLRTFLAVRQSSLELLGQLGLDALCQKSGWHPEVGIFTGRDWIDAYAEHVLIHTEQLKRALRGEP
jgi:hypothetical protein